ncbi:MAG: hypothetical protein Q8N20_03775 [Eubacteriales bacterium]|nr:hypothetical protein [Eubacteriales bacterium]MDZ7611128.1 hypothetical protein [Eubacteriales bacterium]
MENRMEQLGSLVYTVHEGEKRLGKVGHTLLQKLFYLLQYGEGVELGYKYSLHYYGPYCRELWSDLNLLDSHGVVKVDASSNGFGYRIGYGKNQTAAADLEGFVNPAVKEKVEKLLSLLGGEPVTTLEKLATTHFVLGELNRRGKVYSEETVVSVVQALKPHLGPVDVTDAITTLKKHQLIQ